LRFVILATLRYKNSKYRKRSTALQCPAWQPDCRDWPSCTQYTPSDCRFHAAVCLSIVVPVAEQLEEEGDERQRPRPSGTCHGTGPITAPIGWAGAIPCPFRFYQHPHHRRLLRHLPHGRARRGLPPDERHWVRGRPHQGSWAACTTTTAGHRASAPCASGGGPGVAGAKAPARAAGLTEAEPDGTFSRLS
jgi:hypothetical protein